MNYRYVSYNYNHNIIYYHYVLISYITLYILICGLVHQSTNHSVNQPVHLLPQLAALLNLETSATTATPTATTSMDTPTT